MSPGVRPRICFFVGPSLPTKALQAACSALDADVLFMPPIQQGDLLRLSGELPEVVGIVDGYFFQVPSVLHKEILLTLERGARVLGAASLGALRAVELDAFGMEGVGAIYHLYKRGVIDGDDEVAVLHGGPDEDFRPLTEPLVNVRHNLRRARQRGIISVPTASVVLRIARRLHFTERTYRVILDRLDGEAVPAAERLELGRFLHEEMVDLKREDALLLVQTIVERQTGRQPWPPRRAIRFNRTLHFQRYELEYSGGQAVDEHVSDAAVLSFEQLLSPSFPGLVRRVTRRWLAVDEATSRGLEADGPAVLLARFRRRQALRRDDRFQRWLEQRHLSLDELLTYLRDCDLEWQLSAANRADHIPITRGPPSRERLENDVAARLGIPPAALARPLLMQPGVRWSGPLLREIKLRGDYGPALRQAGQIQRFCRDFFHRNPWLEKLAPSQSRLDAWCAARWGVDDEQLTAAMFDRGFAGPDALLSAAGPAYLWEQFHSLRETPTADVSS